MQMFGKGVANFRYFILGGVGVQILRKSGFLDQN